MAFNLSSVTQSKQDGVHGQKSLNNIASVFGSVVCNVISDRVHVEEITLLYEVRGLIIF